MPHLGGRRTGTAWGHPSPLSFSAPAPPFSSAPGTPTGPPAPQGWAQPEEHTRGWGVQSNPALDVGLPSFCGLACGTEGPGPGWPPARLHFLGRKSLSVSRTTPGPTMLRLRTARSWSLGPWAPPQELSQQCGSQVGTMGQSLPGLKPGIEKVGDSISFTSAPTPPAPSPISAWHASRRVGHGSAPG